MVGSLMTQLLGCIIESNVSVCVEIMIRELMHKLVFENNITANERKSIER